MLGGMDQRVNFADAAYEPSDEDLQRLAREAFEDVPRLNREALDRLYAEVRALRAQVQARLAARAGDRG